VIGCAVTVLRDLTKTAATFVPTLERFNSEVAQSREEMAQTRNQLERMAAQLPVQSRGAGQEAGRGWVEGAKEEVKETAKSLIPTIGGRGTSSTVPNVMQKGVNAAQGLWSKTKSAFSGKH
jgi:uncharacterized coiled-coil protein SlyX